jgi:hypothetical protein
MNICHSIVLLLLVCFIPQLALAGEGQLISDTVPSRALEGNLLGDTADRSVLVYLPPSYDSMETHFATPCGRKGGFKDCTSKPRWMPSLLLGRSVR